MTPLHQLIEFAHHNIGAGSIQFGNKAFDILVVFKLFVLDTFDFWILYFRSRAPFFQA